MLERLCNLSVVGIARRGPLRVDHSPTLLTLFRMSASPSESRHRVSMSTRPRHNKYGAGEIAGAAQ